MSRFQKVIFRWQSKIWTFGIAQHLRKHRIEANKTNLKIFFPLHLQHETWKILMRNVVFSTCRKNQAWNWWEVIIGPAHHVGLKIQSFSFMTIISFFKNLAKTIKCEHDEVMLLLVENDRNFSVIVASTSFSFLVTYTCYVYIHSRKPIKLLLLENRSKSIDLRRWKKYNFSFLQRFIWFKVNWRSFYLCQILAFLEWFVTF